MDPKTIRFIILFLFTFSIFQIKSIQANDDRIFQDKIHQSIQLRQFYFPYYNQTLDLIDAILHNQERSTTSACDQSLSQLKSGLINFDEWALKCTYIKIYKFRIINQIYQNY